MLYSNHSETGVWHFNWCIDRTFGMTSDAPSDAESMLPQTLLVHVASNTHKIKSSDWPKRHCAK